jgi:hypothetical protein
VRDQVSHPYKTTGRIMFLCILTFTFLKKRRKDKRVQNELLTTPSLLFNWYKGFSSSLKQSKHNIYSPSFVAEVRNEWSFIQLPQYVFVIHCLGTGAVFRACFSLFPFDVTV